VRLLTWLCDAWQSCSFEVEELRTVVRGGLPVGRIGMAYAISHLRFFFIFLGGLLLG
jgi:hypothetical protein